MIKENINGNERKAATRLGVMYYARSTDCVFRIRQWQNQHQRSVNTFRSCKIFTSKLIWSWLFAIQVLAVFIGNNYRDMFSTAF